MARAGVRPRAVAMALLALFAVTATAVEPPVDAAAKPGADADTHGTVPVTLEGLLQSMTDLVRLTRRLDPVQRNLQSTSYDRSSDPPCAPGDGCWFANVDYGEFLAEEQVDGRTEYVMLDVAGPGAVERIWTANPTGTLRVYIDDAPSPEIEQPMAALLNGSIAPFHPPLAHRVAEGYSLYFPIPFATRCKITVDSNNPSRGNGVYYHVGYRLYEPGTSVVSFSLLHAQAIEPLILDVAAKLDNPATTYTPSPKTITLTGTLTPDDVLTLTDPFGNGKASLIRELRLTPSSTDEQALRETLLEIAFDGETTVRAPLGDFFGSGPGLNPYVSLPAEVHADGTLISRWPMPLQQTATLYLEGGGATPPAVNYEIRVEPYVWGAESLYFHAGWNADHAVFAHGPRDWNWVTIVGAGHYVGNALNVSNPFLAWWGEGDERIWVDAEPFPDLFGTGTEDYYGYAWADNELFGKAYHAQTRAEGAPTINFGRSSVNRWHVLDAIPFTQSLRFDMEQNPTVQNNVERRTLFDVMNFWYAAPGSTDNLPALTPEDLVVPAIPPLVERGLPGIVYDAEFSNRIPSAGTTSTQLMQTWEVGGLVWAQHRQLFWYGAQPGDALEILLWVAAPGAYCVAAWPTSAPDYGTFGLRVNDATATTVVDLAGPVIAPLPATSLGVQTLGAGWNSVHFDLLGSAMPGAYRLGLDAITLIGLDGPVEPATLHVGATELSWGGEATAFDVVRGDLDLLRSTGDFAAATTDCLIEGTGASSLATTEAPAPGQAWWYLARGNPCITGTFDSNGDGQSASRDAGIATAAPTCP